MSSEDIKPKEEEELKEEEKDEKESESKDAAEEDEDQKEKDLKEAKEKEEKEKEEKAKKDKDKENEAEGAEGVPDPDAFVFSGDSLIADIQRKVLAVFEVFDIQNLKTVDVREVGTMCRALDIFPTEADVHEVIGNVEESTAKGTVKMSTFINHMTKVICEGRYKPTTKDEMSKIFQTLDKERKGVLDPAKVREILMKEGEAFTTEEVEEMFNFSVNKVDNFIHWEEYMDKLFRALHL